MRSESDSFQTQASFRMRSSEKLGHAPGMFAETTYNGFGAGFLVTRIPLAGPEEHAMRKHSHVTRPRPSSRVRRRPTAQKSPFSRLETPVTQSTVRGMPVPAQVAGIADLDVSLDAVS